MDDRSLYREMYRIRRFEEIVLVEFSRGRFSGTTHTYLGQEANAVSVLTHRSADDIVVSNHRCHGHFLAYGGEPRALFAELMGKATGVCGGRGGSQHLHWRNFYSNGVLGGTVPLATGMALAEKQKKSGSLVIVFLGDGALGEGVVYESLNMASLWKVPIVFVLEDNRIAQTTPVDLHLAGDIAARFLAFGIATDELDSSDVHEILPAARTALEAVRRNGAPRALVLHTHRFGPHSKGDDTRAPEAIAVLRREHDPLGILEKRLAPAELEQLRAEVDELLAAAFQQAMDDPFPGEVRN
jgi:TPP-dependent pyruvate/acetoin dehydrogenase alpha subunit